MKIRTLALAAALALVLTSCSNGKVGLKYAFDENTGTKYLWTIDSNTTIDSSTDHSSSRSAMVIELVEKVSKPSRNGNPVLTIELTPRSMSQDGREAKTPSPAKIQYQLNKQGHIVKPITSDLETQVASAVELGTILSQSRLALPGRQVGIGDKWNAPLKLNGDTGAIDLKGTGKLEGFELNGKRKLARIATTRSGKITAEEELAGVLVNLKGNTTSTGASRLDIDQGILYSSLSQFNSDFDLALEETGKLTGTLMVSLTSRLELQPG